MTNNNNNNTNRKEKQMLHLDEIVAIKMQDGLTIEKEQITDIVLDSGDSINPDFDYDSVISKFRKIEVPAVRYEIRGPVADRNVLHTPRISLVEEELQDKSVKLRFIVRSDGTVYDVRIIESSYQKLTEKAIDFVSKFLFTRNRGEQSGEIRILFIKPDI